MRSCRPAPGRAGGPAPSAARNEVMTSVPPSSEVASPSDDTVTSMRSPGPIEGGKSAVTITAATLRVRSVVGRGGLLVLVVSFLSLGWRTGIVVALSVPLVLGITFIVMMILGIDLHRITLGALIIALGLMTGLHRRTGVSIRLVRTGLEVTVVVVGWLLGGVVGVGTVLYAIAIGPLVQLMLPACIVEVEPADPSTSSPRSSSPR